MSIEENKRAASAFIQAIADVDGEAMRSILSADAVMHMQKSSGAWYGAARTVKGNNAIAALLTAHHGADGQPGFWKTGSTRWDHMSIIAEGALVAIQTERNSITSQGVDYENEYVWIFRFDESTISDIWEYTDSAYAHTVVQPPTKTNAAWRGLSE